MPSPSRPDLQGLRVVSFESRRAKEMAELIRRYGGDPVIAPSLREIPLNENRRALALFPEIENGKFDLLLLTTGVGTRTLNDVFLTAYPQEKINAALNRLRIVARGPKPIAVLRELGLQPAVTVPEPNTWREVVAAMEAAVELRGKRMAIQEYGVTNRELLAALEARGATVVSVPVYRWALPEDLAPLRKAIRRILRGTIDIVLFTNGAQAEHVFKVASEDSNTDALRDAMAKVVIGSVGPVCTIILEQFGLTADIQPAHPKMGSLIAEVAQSARVILKAKHHS